MKNLFRILFTILLSLPLWGVDGGVVSAQQRRPVDSQHPMWLVHVDVWNQADPQKIIDLIPEDIRPYVVMNLSLSCAYDKEINIHQRPQNAIRTYKSWATVCQMNNMWFTLQPASGGHTHLHDNDLEAFEYFFKKYPNFLGWNFAEQFWGFNDPGDNFSSSDVDRIALFAKLVPMHHKYGGFLTISFCGNVWSHPLNPVGMLKRNADLLQASKDYPEAILWLYKYTTSSCFYNNESVCFGPFVAGLTKNYGVRYDNCGWNGALDDLFPHNSDGSISSAYKSQRDAMKYPVAAGIGTVMEQTCQNGGAVWDGPELIWTECFQNQSNETKTFLNSNFSCRRWTTFPGMRNAWIDMWRKIVDGTMYIPTQQEVIDKTKIIVVNNVKSGSDEDMYAAWGDLYDGLYKQTDRFNRNNGQWMDNYLYLKKTGRYGTIPITPTLTEVSKNIPVKVAKASYKTTWTSQTAKVNAFNAQYPEVSTGDLFVSRYKNQLVTYYPHSYMNTKKTAEANIPLQYNTCESLDLSWNTLSSALVKEYSDHIDFYLNNFRNDTTTKKKDIIIVNGATEKPSFTYTKREQCLINTPVETWDEANKKYTLAIEHDGPVDVKINCAGAATGRATDYLPNTKLELPKQPEKYYGTLIIEAEDMDTRSVKGVEQTPYYSSYRWVRGQSGNGFVLMGTDTKSALHRTIKVNKGGKYKMSVRYNNNTIKSDLFYLRVNNDAAQSFTAQKTAQNEWRKDGVTLTLKDGDNDIYLLNNKGIDMMVDQVILTPEGEEAEKFDINIVEADGGSVVADCNAAEEGKKVILTIKPQVGHEFVRFNVIHGDGNANGDCFKLEKNVDGTYTLTMPDDIVTLEPVFRDNSIAYNLDFDPVLSGNIPEGWRCFENADGTEIHQYPNSYGSGSRTFKGFTGTYSKGLYWKTNSCDFGMQDGYTLTLKPGKYQLVYAMAAWKGTPQCKAQITTKNGAVLAQETSFITATPNANGSTAADLSKAKVSTMEFEVKNEANYVIKFVNNGTGFSEFLLMSCRLNKVMDMLKGDVNLDGKVDAKDADAIVSVICGDKTYAPTADLNEDGNVNIIDLSIVMSLFCK